MYDTLTFQCNLTLYKKGGTIRGVVIVRDPDHNNEVSRRIHPASANDGESYRRFLLSIMSALGEMEHLMLGDVNTVKQALMESTPPPAPSTPTPRKRATKKA